MSPKKISNLALVITGISVSGAVAGLFFAPQGEAFNWWPLAGLGLSLVLVIIALIRGAYLAGQRQVSMVDMRNDCNAGILSPDDPQ
jgi:hypothetical protein